MSTRTLQIDDALYDYLLNVSLREHPLLTELRDVTAKHVYSQMQISPEQGQFMALLVRLCGVRRAVEIGTFTGYSALSVALALPEDGKLIACDISEEFTAIGRPFWQRAGVAGKIDLRIGPAMATLDKLLSAGSAGEVDFIFIDADKGAYDEYYERCLQLIRQGGLIAFDNTLWGGKVAHAAADDDTRAIQALNRKLHGDERIDLSLVPIGDGLTLARKR
jgi:predicted O-methyltransferase YrrM